MIFNPTQVSELVDILNSQHILFIGQNLGPDVLSDQDKAVLRSHGLEIEDPEDYVELAFKFGLISQSLSTSTVKNMKWDDFKKFIKEGKYLPLTGKEKETVKVLKTRTYSHIKGLGNKVSSELQSQIVEVSNIQRIKTESLIKKELSEGVANRKSVSQIVSNLGHKTGDWHRDWSRIVETELQNAFEEGRAFQIKRDNPGKDPDVYKDVFQGACHSCISAYLTAGIGSKPKVFKLSQLELNGTNIGKKQAEWKPVVMSMHPYCRCLLSEVPEDREWDEDTKSFSKLKPVEERKKKIERQRIRAVIGSKEFLV